MSPSRARVAARRKYDIGLIWVGLNAPAQPCDGFCVGPELRFGNADTVDPSKRIDIAGREAERLVDMGLGFRAATEKNLGPTNASVSVGQISIQRQCLLAFGDAFGRAVREIMWTTPRTRWASA